MYKNVRVTPGTSLRQVCLHGSADFLTEGSFGNAKIDGQKR